MNRKRKFDFPANYNQTNITYEIPSFSDADRMVTWRNIFEDIAPIRIWGDNHCGYIGFRNPFADSFNDDGTMYVVVRDWKVLGFIL